MNKQGLIFSYFCLALMLLLVMFYSPWLVNLQSFYLSDLTYYFEPFSRFIGNSLREGHWPLWNPLAFCGMSQIAIPSPGIFYPFTWLSQFLAFSPALALSMVFHQWLFGVGSFLLVSSWGVVPVGAAVCGLSMALCGYMFSLHTNYSLVETAAWVPLTLWLLRRISACQGGLNLGWVIAASMSVFMLLAAGRPEIFAPALLLIGFCLVASAIASYRLDRLGRKAVFTLLWRISAIACGIALAAPCLLPSFEWAQLSVRAAGLAANEIFIWSSSWYDLLNMVTVQPLGDLTHLGARFLPIAASRSNFIPYVSSLFIGPVTITFGLWGLFDKNWKERPIVVLVLIASLLMSLGNNTPLAPWLISTFPILGVFRYPEKLLIFALSAIALLSARGVHLCLTVGLSRLAKGTAWTFWFLWLLAGVILNFFPSILSQLVPGIGSNQALAKQAGILIGQSAITAALMGIAVCCLAYAYSIKRIGKPAFSAMILGALTASLMTSAFISCRHGTEPAFFNHQSYLQAQIQKLQSTQKNSRASAFRVLSLFFDPLTYPNSYQGESGESSTPAFYQYGRQLLLPNTHMDALAPCSYGYESAETGLYRKLFWGVYMQSHAFLSNKKVTNDNPLARFCQMTSTAYVYTQVFRNNPVPRDLPLLDKGSFDLVHESRQMNVRIYRIANAVPRVYFPTNWTFVDSANKAVEQIIKSDSSSFDAMTHTIVESSTPKNTFEALFAQGRTVNSSPLLTPNSGIQIDYPQVEIHEQSPEHLELQVQCNQPRLLVLADQFYPGWQAKIDGQRSQIWRANGVLKAVFIPSGTHHISFEFISESLTLGLALAALALGFLIILALCILAGRMSKPPRQSLGFPTGLKNQTKA